MSANSKFRTFHQICNLFILIELSSGIGYNIEMEHSFPF